ncbi:MAG: phosphoribosylformylglycinamidine synthase subunit PurS [bacterium]|nr:phosphoribosylformylglycinamidine synthase subunit PurS [bacterium]
MKYFVEVYKKNGFFDPDIKKIEDDLKTLFKKKFFKIKKSIVYELSGNINLYIIREICKELLVDHIVEAYRITKNLKNKKNEVRISLKEDVLDPRAELLVNMLKVYKINKVKIVDRLKFEGLNKYEISKFVKKFIINPLIHEYRIYY